MSHTKVARSARARDGSPTTPRVSVSRQRSAVRGGPLVAPSMMWLPTARLVVLHSGHAYSQRLGYSIGRRRPALEHGLDAEQELRKLGEVHLDVVRFPSKRPRTSYPNVSRCSASRY